MRRLLLLSLLTLAACGQGVPVGNVTSSDESAPDTVAPEPAPVRIGELGASLEACAGAGTPRRLQAGETLPVRSAPFDNAPQTGTVAAGGRFFICSRSLDQKWFGIVYDPSGMLARRCAVSEPVGSKRAYSGPCASGWVSSPFVKMIAGEEPQGAQTAPPGPPGGAKGG